MPEIVLYFLLLCSLAFCVAFLSKAIDNYFWIIPTFLMPVLFVLMVFWLYTAFNKDRTYSKLEVYPLENVTMSDGSQIQVIHRSPLDVINITGLKNVIYPTGSEVNVLTLNHFSHWIYIMTENEYQYDVIIPPQH